FPIASLPARYPNSSDTKPSLLFHHSSRVYYWGSLGGKRRGLTFDPELLYGCAMFHDMGLTAAHSSTHERFEVDGANAARNFLRSRGNAQQDIDAVWPALPLHTTPGAGTSRHQQLATRARRGLTQATARRRVNIMHCGAACSLPRPRRHADVRDE